MSIVWEDYRNFVKHKKEYLKNHQLFCTSGGCDPLHSGHIKCLQDMANMARTDPRDAKSTTILLLNGDRWLAQKKGYVFMNWAERATVVSVTGLVDHVVYWDDGSDNVAGAILDLSPDFFLKGGSDRGPSELNLDEVEACKKVGTKIVCGVGGWTKECSSSDLVKRAWEQLGLCK